MKCLVCGEELGEIPFGYYVGDNEIVCSRECLNVYFQQGRYKNDKRRSGNEDTHDNNGIDW